MVTYTEAEVAHRPCWQRALVCLCPSVLEISCTRQWLDDLLQPRESYRVRFTRWVQPYVNRFWARMEQWRKERDERRQRNNAKPPSPTHPGMTENQDDSEGSLLQEGESGSESKEELVVISAEELIANESELAKALARQRKLARAEKQAKFLANLEESKKAKSMSVEKVWKF